MNINDADESMAATITSPRTRVLLVEDEALVAKQVAERLTEAGLEVVGIERYAEAAIATAPLVHPDVVLMDVRLAGVMDGIEAAAIFAERYIAPVIFLTAHSDVATLARARNAEPYGYLVKPIVNRDIGPTIAMAMHRFQLERRLRESEERFRGAFDRAAIGMALVSPGAHFLQVNLALCEMLGYGADALIGMSWPALTDAQDGARDAAYLHEMLTGEPSYRHFETRFLHKDGRTVWGRVALSLVRDSLCMPLYFVAQIEDITERKRAAEQFRLAIEAAPTGMLVIDRAGTIVLANARLEKLFGYEHDELIGHRVEMLLPEHFRNRHPKFRIDFFADAQARPMGAGRDLRGLRKDGTEVPIEIGLNPLETAEGIFVLSSVVDISERKRLEKALGDAVQREQRRLGEQIHEGLSQDLTGLSFLASSLERDSARANSPLADTLATIASGLRKSVETCRNIARGISPLTESRGSLVASLRQIEARAAASGRAGVSVKVTENAPLSLSWESRDHLYRIAQEAVDNALERRGAGVVEIAIRIDPALVTLEIAHDGRELDSMGVRAPDFDRMRQRATAIGAALRVEARPKGVAAIVCECAQAPWDSARESGS